MPLSRRVEYVMDGSMDEWVSETHTNQIGSTTESKSNFFSHSSKNAFIMQSKSTFLEFLDGYSSLQI